MDGTSRGNRCVGVPEVLPFYLLATMWTKMRFPFSDAPVQRSFATKVPYGLKW